MVYKVWVQIERYSERSDEFVNIDEPIDIAVFGRLRDARKYVKNLTSENCDCADEWKARGIYPFKSIG